MRRGKRVRYNRCPNHPSLSQRKLGVIHIVKQHPSILKPSHLVLLLWTLILATTAFTAVAQTAEGPAKNWAPGSPELIQPDDLVKAMKGPQKPTVLYVGPKAFYQQAHVPGAEYIGATARPEGLEQLRTRSASIKHDAPVVIYCGCCPWDHCPNIRPAYDELHKMGFTNLKVLYLPGTFGTSWADKGLPVEKGQ
jgi:thiosulfate/3-mercaptopyruvate sulfurtransferase